MQPHGQNYPSDEGKGAKKTSVLPIESCIFTIFQKKFKNLMILHDVTFNVTAPV
jgi:hypothetical protein